MAQQPSREAAGSIIPRRYCSLCLADKAGRNDPNRLGHDRESPDRQHKRLLRAASHRFDNHRLDRDVRHEATIHYVAMDPVGSCRIDGTNLLGETPEIRRQD
jgi:hypothetical protein